MPRSAYFTKDSIVNTALQLIREQGHDALSARSLGKALGCSISPIFTVFNNMDEVSEAVLKSAQKILMDYMADVREYVPAFKEFAVRIIRFAREEKKLFIYLFIQNGKTSTELVHPIARQCMEDICTVHNITTKQAEKLFEHMWIFIAGLALYSAKEPGKFTEEYISELLTFNFISLVNFVSSGENIVGMTPRIKKDGELSSIKIQSI